MRVAWLFELAVLYGLPALRATPIGAANAGMFGK
jgi:hypothetical protein